jgi:hypothetical protein
MTQNAQSAALKEKMIKVNTSTAKAMAKAKDTAARRKRKTRSQNPSQSPRRVDAEAARRKSNGVAR